MRSNEPSILPVFLLAFVLVGGIPTPLDAQARAPSSRQAREVDPTPCSTGPDCVHHLTYYVDGGSTLTEVAGFATGSGFTLHRTVETTTSWDIYASGPHLSEIIVGERGDEPCYLRIRSDEVGDVETWNRCGVSGPSSRQSVRWRPDHALVGIRVCTNNRNDDRGMLVKGVEVRVARRPYLSGAARMMVRESFARPNCRQWRSWVMCPAGTAATMLRGRHIAIGGRRGLVGLQLDCAPVEAACFHASSVGDDDAPVCRPS